MSPDPDFWRGKRVLLTGHTGFKGAWLALWLRRLGAEVVGLSLAPATRPSLHALAGIGAWMPQTWVDVRDAAAVAAQVRHARPDIVFHLAAQALVRPSYADPAQTFMTNVMGTVHLLDALRVHPGTRVVLVATTDKVYRNREAGEPFREGDELGGCDPYSASKAATELVLESYRDAFLADAGVAVASVRAGDVIGGGDFAPQRLLPDAMRAWAADRVLQVRHPLAVRPWQHVLEPLAAYLELARRLWSVPADAGAYNCGPAPSQCCSVREVLQHARTALGCGRWDGAVPVDGLHEHGTLLLDSSRLDGLLGRRARWSVAQAVARSVYWYQAVHDGADAATRCLADIDAFEEATCAA